MADDNLTRLNQDPEHRRMPSVELTERQSNPRHPGDSRSRIPRPITSRSSDFGRRYADRDRSRSVEGLGSGVRNQAFEREESFSENRTARYHGKFSSYDEMLGNMDEQDPFQGAPKPPREDLVKRARERTKENLKSRSDMHTTSVSMRAPGGQDGGESGSKPRRKKKRTAPSSPEQQKDNDEDPLAGTYTIMKDNPMYEAYKPPNKRKGSGESTGTYVLDGHGSKTKLIGRDEVRPSSVEPSITSPAVSKPVHVPDHQRAVKISEHVLERQISDLEETIGEHRGRRSPLERQDTVFSLLGDQTPHDDQLREAEQNAIVDYIHLANIQMRQCKKYIPVPVDPNNQNKNRTLDDDSCSCGRELAWHVDGVKKHSSKEKEKWSIEKHTELLPTTCYGTIAFQGFGPEASRNAPYVRIDQGTGPEKVWQLAIKKWKMPKPKLIISVTGGAKRFFLKSRLRENFKRGLVNVATTTGAWIITGGTSAGVMQFVGEAVRDFTLTAGATEQKVVALGIATWGIVDNRDALTPDDLHLQSEGGLFPAEYNFQDLSSKDVRGVSPLDHNHTHFILVDNGMEKKFGAEIKFRGAFEKYISQETTGLAREQSVSIPVVLLVLEGGENTIRTALEALENSTPVVVIQGSGRAADVMAFAYKYFKNRSNDKEKIKFAPDKIDQDPPNPKAFSDIRDKVEKWLDWSRENKNPKQKAQKIFSAVKNIEKMIENRNLLTVFHMDDIDTTNEIDQAILYALLKAKKSEFLQQLNLALAWNRCDIAREEIFKNENKHEWLDKMYALYEAMFTALVQDRVDFVKLFLDNGVEWKEFLDVKRLENLYDEVLNSKLSGAAVHLFKGLLEREQPGTRCPCCPNRDASEHSLVPIGQIINNLTGDRYENLYQDKYRETDESCSSSYKQSHDLNGTTMMTARSLSKKKSRVSKQGPTFERPERELLFWAVLFNRKELALLFWKMGKDHIGGAQTASAMFKSLGQEAGVEEELDLSNELNANADEFEDLAVGVLNNCYQRDKHMAHQLLVRSLPMWGQNTTVLSIADASEQMNLMGHSGSQTKLNKAWKGKMALYTATWKIILGLLFFPFIVPTMKFTSTGKTTKQPNKVKPKEKITKRKQFSTLECFKLDFDWASSHAEVPSLQHNRRAEKQARTDLYDVHLCGCYDEDGDGDDKKQYVNYFRAIIFYHTAPLVKFCYHTLSYIVFLGLFCYFLLTDMRHTDVAGPSMYEYIVWGWAGTMLLEEIRQICTRGPRTLRHKFASYFSSVWNQFDMFVYMLLILCVILRFTLPYERFVWARRVYAITLTLFFLRFLHTFYVLKNVGPKVIMIRQMLTDLIFFVLILVVFVFGYGVASQVLQNPNSAPSWEILRKVVYMPYWHIYGELFLENIEGTAPDCEPGADFGPNCPQEKSWLVMVLLALYMIFTNVLLLNLLIAMFSHTFARVQDNSEKLWRFFRYGLFYEYFDKPTLAPPLIIFSHMYRMFRHFHRKCEKHDQPIDTDFYKDLSADLNNKLTAFEKAGMENFLLQRHILGREHIDAKVASTGERIEKVICDLEQIKETVVVHTDDFQEVASPPPAITETDEGPKTSRSVTVEHRENFGVLQSRISGLQEQLEDQYHQMNKMCSMLDRLTTKLDDMEKNQAEQAEVQRPPLTRAIPWDISHSVDQALYRGRPADVGRYRQPYNHRTAPDTPQIEIQEFPPGYNDGQ